MQLAILHYHLNRGGVTQAILNHLESLATCDAGRQPDRIALITSGRRDGWPNGDWRELLPFECQLVTVPTLDYDTGVGAEPDALAEAIAHGLSEAGFDLSQTVLHTHNHALGKNASLPGALARLAEGGCRLLLQVHDFAEDFRPANYRHLMRATRAASSEALAGVLYPQGPGVHYATLTTRDHKLLAKAGVAEERLHVLPNPVAEWRGLPQRDDVRGDVEAKLDIDPSTRLVVYPVRGIRRKNVGEMLLHSALAGTDSCYAVTLAPENPLERASFDRWQSLADGIGLGCRFGIGQGGVEFTDAIAAADAVVTTSVAEGFGMVFLETCLAGRPLIGRNLPDITCDFTESGLKFPGLFDELRVPVEWTDKKQVREQLLELHKWACRDYNTEPAADSPAIVDGMLESGSIDFATLPSLCQAEVIGAVAKDREEALEAVAACNAASPGVTSMFGGEADASAVASNAERVREAYSPAAVGERLADTFAAVMNDTPSGSVDPAAGGANILKAFLRIDRLRPVRIEA